MKARFEKFQKDLKDEIIPEMQDGFEKRQKNLKQVMEKLSLQNKMIKYLNGTVKFLNLKCFNIKKEKKKDNVNFAAKVIIQGLLKKKT